MKKDIYGKLKKEKIKRQIVKTEVLEVKRSMEVPLIIKMQMPDTQRVEVINPVEIPEYPQPKEVQKVEVLNQVPMPPVIFPKTQLVHVDNPTPPTESADLTNVEQLLADISNKEVLFPETQRVEVTNPPVDIPIGKGDVPKKADPTRYVPVRLTNGKRFYEALADAYVSAAKATQKSNWATAVNPALSATPMTVKGSAGEFGGYYYFNPNDSPVYIQVFDKVSPNVGTDNAKLIFGIPANGGANIEIKNGIGFSKGISAAATTTATGSNAPSSALIINFYYL
jgi:hypothetical protein